MLWPIKTLEYHMENLNSLKSAELILAATSGNEVAKAELVRRHENRVSKGKKPIPAVAKFLGLAPAKPSAPAKPAKTKPHGESKIPETDAELEAKYAKCSAAFLRNMLAKTKDARKKKFQLAALNAISGPSVTTATPVKPSAPISDDIAGIIKALGSLGVSDRASVVAALTA
jgi:hypothetical protein